MQLFAEASKNSMKIPEINKSWNPKNLLQYITTNFLLTADHFLLY